MSEIDWSSNAVRVLMAQYERRPELWDRQHSLYRATTAKYKAWMSLAKIFSCDVTELRKKFNSLLASYRRERSKVKEGGRSGWFLYPHMAFLPGYLRNPPPPGAPHHPHQEEAAAAVEETYESGAEEPDPLYRYETESEHEQDAASTAASQGREDPLVKPEPQSSSPHAHAHAHAALYKDYQFVRNKKRLTRTLKRGRERPKEVTKSYVERRLRDVEVALCHGGGGGGGGSGVRRDDCDTYGEYIAATLRKHDNKTQCLIKQAINSILFEQEMSQYSNPLEAEMVTEMLDASEDDQM